MSILVDENTRLLVQGITGRNGMLHARLSKDYGTRVVAGVTPGKGGTKVDGVPVFNTVEEARRETECNVSVIFVPAPFAADAIMEAAASCVELVACITEGIPLLDIARVVKSLEGGSTRLIGPNCPGVISPGKARVGIMPAHIHRPGNIGIISRSGTLTYETVDQLTREGLGQSTCVGIGGDPITGSSFMDMLRLFESDKETEAVILIGEIGGTAEEEAANYIRQGYPKPVFGFVAGLTAPEGKRMGHAGAIISEGRGTAEEKIKALDEAGVHVVHNIGEVGTVVRKTLAKT
ncbi:MAG: succinate--CoA ligase subunit alpha [Deltaproteobacteria bacterium]|nr:succinate--CoA ligase subunit alpha [Deltaproteobacteria bacterium]